MALQKDIQTNFGVTATYHHVRYPHFDVKDGVGRVEIWSYLNKEARDSGADPLAKSVQHFGVTPPQQAGREAVQNPPMPFTYDGDTAQQAYEAIKQLPQWADAVDILE